MVRHHSRFVRLSFIGLICATSAGCWSIFGRESEFVRPVPPEGLLTGWFWLILCLSVLSFVLQMLGPSPKKDSPRLAVVLFNPVGILIQLGLAFTIVGTFTYWVFSTMAGWGVIGLILLVIMSLASGFSRGLYGATPLFLYLIYHDPMLLKFVALPALIADCIEVIIRWSKKGEE